MYSVIQKIKDLSPATKRYLFIGITVYLLELAVIGIAQYAGLSAVVAVGAAFWIGLVISFLLQKFITFGDKRTQAHIVFRQVFLFSLLVLWNFGFTVSLAALVGNFLPAIIVRTVALATTTVWNFYLYKTHIFSASAN